MLKVALIQALPVALPVLFSVITSCSCRQREYEYVLNRIDVCFYVKSGSSKSCETFANLTTAMKEFMSLPPPRAKVEIRDQPALTKVRKCDFCRIQYVKELVIRNCGLVDIQPGAFEGSLSLLKLDLQRNQLKTIKTGIFNNLLLTNLNLSYNKINTIQTDALSSMLNLETIDLSHNQISFYDVNWFKETPLIKSLYFQNNFILELPEGAFREMVTDSNRKGNRPDVRILFSYNRIRFIHPAAFDGMGNTTIAELHLDHNLLTDWIERWSTNINELEISFNNIKCISGNLLVTIKNNSLENFIENPYDCACLKEIKTIGDHLGDHSEWFKREYLRCRGNRRQNRQFSGAKMLIFSSP